MAYEKLGLMLVHQLRKVRVSPVTGSCPREVPPHHGAAKGLGGLRASRREELDGPPMAPDGPRNLPGRICCGWEGTLPVRKHRGTSVLEVRNLRLEILTRPRVPGCFGLSLSFLQTEARRG